MIIAHYRIASIGLLIALTSPQLIASEVATSSTEPLIIGSETFEQASIATNAGGITITHTKGIFRVDYAEMSPEDQARFGYNPDQYKQWQAHKQRQQDARALTAKRKSNAAKVAAIRKQPANLEVTPNTRSSSFWIAKASRLVPTQEKQQHDVTLERLARPGMREETEQYTINRTKTVTRKVPIAQPIAIYDPDGTLQADRPWQGTLYATALKHENAPVYLIKPHAILTLQSDAPTLQSDAPALSIGKLLSSGLADGFLLPLKVIRHTLTPAALRTPIYWIGFAIGIAALIIAAYFLFFGITKCYR